MLDTIQRPITDQNVLNAVNANPELQVTADPTRRFGYNPCIPNLSMSPSGSGLNSPVIEPGQLLMFVPRIAYHRGQFNPLSGVYPRIATRRYPNEFARAVKLKFQDQQDFGYRNLEALTPLEYQVTTDGYFDEAYKYWDVVHRQISCTFGLETYVPHEHGDDTFQPCPVCRIADLESTSLQQSIRAVGNDMDVAVLENLRITLIAANRAAIRHIEERLEKLSGEMELSKTGGVGRRFFTESDKYFMKMIHRKPEGDKQVDLLQQTIQANSQAIQMAMSARPQPAVSDGQVALSPEEYREYLDMKAKQEAARERMANARAAKENKNESNDTGGNKTEPERTDGNGGE